MQPRKVCGVCVSLNTEEIRQRRSLTFTLAEIFQTLRRSRCHIIYNKLRPTNIDVTALAIAFAAGGDCKLVKTTPLLTIDEESGRVRISSCNSNRLCVASLKQ
jgi:hypothetical protein